MGMESRDVIKFFVEEGMKVVEIIDRLNKHYSRDTFRMQVHSSIKEVNSGRKDLSNTSPRRVQDKGLDNCIEKTLKEDPHLSTPKIATTLNISSTTVRNHLTWSLGMKCYQV
jgi:response regulator of citrate/malate metabolism